MFSKIKNFWNRNYVVFSNESNRGILGFSINVSGYDLIYFHAGKKKMKFRALGRWIDIRVGKD